MKERPYTGFYARLLGGFSLFYQGVELPIPANPQTKGMQLLCMLLKAGPQGVERKYLINFLQGEGGDWEKGLNNLRQRIFLLRKILGRAHFPEGKYISFQDGRYYFSQEYEWENDTDYLDELIGRLRKGGLAEEETWDIQWEYCQSYKGEFLPMLGGEAWAAQEAAYYQKWYFQCVSSLSVHLKGAGEYEKLLSLCTMASRIHPYDEWQTVQIDCLMAMNRYREALRVYEEASDIFYEELGVNTLDQTVAKYRNREGQMYFLANAMTGVKDVLAEEGRPPGAYQCSYPSFLDMYRILARMEERTGMASTLMICTIRADGPERISADGPDDEESTVPGEQEGAVVGRREGNVPVGRENAEPGRKECASSGQMSVTRAGRINADGPGRINADRSGGDEARLEERMEALRNLLAGGIRSGDVYTRYSSRQFLVLLTDATIEQGYRIAERLERNWEETYGHKEGCIEFEVQQTESPGKEECGDGKERNLYGTHHQSGECHLAGPGYLA